MNTIDITTITDIKFFNGIDYTSEAVNIKPDGGIDLYLEMNKLFKARYVRVLERWVDLKKTLPSPPVNVQNLYNFKDGTENFTTSVGDPEQVSYMQMWGFYFPEGEYWFDEVFLRDKIYLLGAGRKTVFKSAELQRLLAIQNDPQGPGVFPKSDFDAIKDILTPPSGFFVHSVMIENITFEDCKSMDLNAKEVIIRNCRFYNMLSTGIGTFKKNSHLLIENNFVGFNPGRIEKGAFVFKEQYDDETGVYGILERDPNAACISMGIKAEALSGVGQMNVVIRNNFFEYTWDNGIQVRGIAAKIATTIAASGVGNIVIEGNRIIKAGKAGIKMTYENDGGANQVLPYGQYLCSILNNQIFEWGRKKPEAAISCDNEAIFMTTWLDILFPGSGRAMEEFPDLPNQEIDSPLDFQEGFEVGDNTDYNAVMLDIELMYEQTWRSYSTGLLVQGNTIMGSGRSFYDSSDIGEAYGITARQWKSAVIANNVITGQTIYNNFNTHYPSGSTVRSGIQLHSCSDFVLSGNQISNSNYIYFIDSANQENDERGGIKLIGCRQGTVNGNTIKNPGAMKQEDGNWQSQGVVLKRTRFCTINANVISCYNPKHLVDVTDPHAPGPFSTIQYAVRELEENVGNPTANSYLRCAENRITDNVLFNIHDPIDPYRLDTTSASGAPEDQLYYYLTLSDSTSV